MQKELIDTHGLCRASIRTEDEIAAIRAELTDDAVWLDSMNRWLEAVKDPTRFKMIHLLYRYDRLCVCDLANVLGVTSSAVSQHLRRLKDMGMVSASRVAQTMFYTLEDREFIAFLDGLYGDAGHRESLAASA